MSSWYRLAVCLMLALNVLASKGEGYHAFSHESLHVWAHTLEILVAFAIIPEAYANGLFTARKHWGLWQRGAKLFLWLTIFLVIRAVAIYLIAVAFEAENPLAVAAGLLATDPAAVGLALGLVSASYLTGLFWQLTVESMLNDAIGIAVNQVAQGLTLTAALVLIGEDIVLALVLAGTMTLARHFLRRSPIDDQHERTVILILHAGFFYIGVQMGVSLILLVAVGSIVGDWLDERFHVPSSTVDVHHQWETLNQVLLAILLGIAAFMMPLQDFVTQPKVVFFGLSLLIGGVVATRFGAAILERIGARILIPHSTKRNGRWGHHYGFEVVSVTGLAGSTMLGVPTIVALIVAAEGDELTASAMLLAIFASWAIIPLALKAIQAVEAEKADVSEGEPYGLGIPSEEQLEEVVH